MEIKDKLTVMYISRFFITKIIVDKVNKISI